MPTKSLICYTGGAATLSWQADRDYTIVGFSGVNGVVGFEPISIDDLTAADFFGPWGNYIAGFSVTSAGGFIPLEVPILSGETIFLTGGSGATLELYLEYSAENSAETVAP